MFDETAHLHRSDEDMIEWLRKQYESLGSLALDWARRHAHDGHQDHHHHDHGRPHFDVGSGTETLSINDLERLRDQVGDRRPIPERLMNAAYMRGLINLAIFGRRVEEATKDRDACGSAAKG